MIAQVIKKGVYGILVLWGVLTLVFLIFQFKSGDITDIKMGERADIETKKRIEKELGLNLPGWKQYMVYMNDALPLSIYNPIEDASAIYLDKAKYNFTALLQLNDSRTLVLKKPHLGNSYQNGRSVLAIISEKFPNTALLATVAICFALIVGIVIGILSALYQNSFFDKGTLLMAVLGMSGPSFFMAIIVSWLGGFLWSSSTDLPLLPFVIFILCSILFWLRGERQGLEKVLSVLTKSIFYTAGIYILLLLLRYIFKFDFLSIVDFSVNLPGTGLNQSGSLKEVDVFTGPYYEWKNLVLPALTLGIRPLAVIVQLMRNSLIEVMQQDYIRTARAKGLDTFRIVLKHALRNAISPVITAVSGWFASMLAGAVFIEFVFGWQGLGLQIYEALINEDMPLVMGAVIFISGIFVLLNILVDLLYRLLDPRIQ
ncbi:MAG: ABC transporter permease [Bacteroidota bacterium]